MIKSVSERRERKRLVLHAELKTELAKMRTIHDSALLSQVSW